MAVLSDNDRKAIWAKFMADIGFRGESPGFTMTKAQIRTAINEIDTWMSDNTASFKAAISEPAATQLTNKYKIELFMLIAQKRWEII